MFYIVYFGHQLIDIRRRMYRKISNIRRTESPNLNVSRLVLQLSLPNPMKPCVLSREWRCSWSSADRRCSNYIWVIDNFIACKGATYIRDLTVGFKKLIAVDLATLDISRLTHLVLMPECSRISRSTPELFDALAPCITRSSATMVLSMQDKWVFVIHEEKISTTSTISVLRND